MELEIHYVHDERGGAFDGLGIESGPLHVDVDVVVAERCGRCSGALVPIYMCHAQSTMCRPAAGPVSAGLRVTVKRLNIHIDLAVLWSQSIKFATRRRCVGGAFIMG